MALLNKIRQHLPQPQRIALDRLGNCVVHLIDEIKVFFGGLART